MSTTYCFIDASNIIYGTRNEGWKVDFKKLYKYLIERYSCEKIYYFAGENKGDIKQAKFYSILEKLGYILVLKPVKLFQQGNGSYIRKANCDVDLTFYAMRDINLYQRVIFLSGDGDFEILMKYFVEKNKTVKVIANGKRTAKEIKILMGLHFIPINTIKDLLEYK